MTGCALAMRSFAFTRKIFVRRSASCPTKKYQNEGGPGAGEIIDLLRTYSTDRQADLKTFVGALGFNWLIAGTDAHAKNFSLLLGGSHVPACATLRYRERPPL